MPNRPILNESKIHPAALSAIANSFSDTVREVESAIASNPVVIVGMKQNPVVKRARNILAAQGIPFKYLEYGSYVSEWKRRLAIKLWSGWPTFPQVFVKGQLLGGCKDVEKLLADGSCKKLLG